MAILYIFISIVIVPLGTYCTSSLHHPPPHHPPSPLHYPPPPSPRVCNISLAAQQILDVYIEQMRGMLTLNFVDRATGCNVTGCYDSIIKQYVDSQLYQHNLNRYWAYDSGNATLDRNSCSATLSFNEIMNENIYAYWNVTQIGAFWISDSFISSIKQLLTGVAAGKACSIADNKSALQLAYTQLKIYAAFSQHTALCFTGYQTLEPMLVYEEFVNNMAYMYGGNILDYNLDPTIRDALSIILSRTDGPGGRSASTVAEIGLNILFMTLYGLAKYPNEQIAIPPAISIAKLKNSLQNVHHIVKNGKLLEVQHVPTGYVKHIKVAAATSQCQAAAKQYQLLAGDAEVASAFFRGLAGGFGAGIATSKLLLTGSTIFISNINNAISSTDTVNSVVGGILGNVIIASEIGGGLVIGALLAPEGAAIGGVVTAWGAARVIGSAAMSAGLVFVQRQLEQNEKACKACTGGTCNVPSFCITPL